MEAEQSQSLIGVGYEMVRQLVISALPLAYYLLYIESTGAPSPNTNRFLKPRVKFPFTVSIGWQEISQALFSKPVERHLPPFQTVLCKFVEDMWANGKKDYKRKKMEDTLTFSKSFRWILKHLMLKGGQLPVLNWAPDSYPKIFLFFASLRGVFLIRS